MAQLNGRLGQTIGLFFFAVLFIVILLNSAPTAAAPTSTPSPSATPFGGGTGKIAFVSNRDGYESIYLMNADGSGIQRITHNVADGEIRGLTWSPDGKHIAFASRRSGNYLHIWVIDTNGSNAHRLTSSYGDFYPAWSPDGTRIAFLSSRSEYYQMYLMDADGRNQRRLLKKGFSDFVPSWSPDSREIAFNYENEVAIVSADSANLRFLTNDGCGAFTPAWSPSGEVIAYEQGPCYGVQPTMEIYEMDSKGSYIRRLTTSGEQSLQRFPAWSPDSKHIAFIADSDIFMVDAEGENLHRLTDGSDRNTFPVWQP